LKRIVSRKLRGLRAGARAMLKASIATVMLVAIEIAVLASLGFSKIVLADALHGVIDVIVGFTVYVALKASASKPSKRFPWGLYKAESLASLAVSLVSVFMVAWITYLALSAMHETTPPHIALLVLIGGLESLVILKYLTRTMERVKSRALQASVTHLKADVLIGVVAGGLAMLAQPMNMPILEAGATVGVALYMAYTAVKILVESTYTLLDVGVDGELNRKMRRIAEEASGLEVSRLKLRPVGSFVVGEVWLRAPGHLTLSEAHKAAVKTVRRILSSIQEVIHVTIILTPKRAKRVKKFIKKRARLVEHVKPKRYRTSKRRAKRS